MQGSDVGASSFSPAPGPRANLASVALPLLLACALGGVAILRLPVIDDEAFAIQLSLRGVEPVLRQGLGQGGHFHPPLNDLLQSLWLSCVTPRPLWLARLPALAWWLATCALLPWAFEPLLERVQRRWAVWATVLYPVHWVLPFVATWYSLGAFSGVLASGAFLRALQAPMGSRSLHGWSCLWALSVITLGYTVFAWPALLFGQLWLALRVLQRSEWGTRARSVAPWLLAIVLGLAPTAWVILDRMSYAIEGQAGGGGLVPLGAILALLAGSTVQANPWLLLAAVGATIAGGVACLRRAGPSAKALFGVGVGVFLTLLLTRTLSDKRLLLGSVFCTVALGAAGHSASRRARMALMLGWAPSALGFLWPTAMPMLFPRWSDPHTELVASHCSAPEPRLLFVDHPALWLTAKAGCGSVALGAEEDPQIIDTSESAEVIARVQEVRQRAPEKPLVIDLVAFLDSPDGWLASALLDLHALGFRVVSDRSLGMDALHSLRDARARAEPRFHWVRLRAP
ncbi:MAG: hypothetical protein QM778_25730 [Myxococcales bacterium]